MPLLASNDPLYHIPGRRRLQDVLTCVREHCTMPTTGHRLPKLAVERLAEADAFGSLACLRRPAAWQALALTDAQLPLFPDLADEADADLPPMPLGQEVLADYATGGLSLKAHPVFFVREQLVQRRVIQASRLRSLHSGWVRVAGLVLIRQRPANSNWRCSVGKPKQSPV